MRKMHGRTADHLALGWGAEIRATLALAWPMILTNLSQFALMLTDGIFLGRLGTEALAASTLGANLFWAVLSPVFGLALAAAPMTAQTRGRGRGFVRGMRRDVRAAIWACIAGTLPVWALLWHADAALVALGQEPSLAALAGEYVRALMWGMPLFCGFVILRGFLGAEERPGGALAVSLLGVALNVPLNWWLIHGGLGVPALGVVGAGLASTLCNLFMFAALVGFIAWDRRLRRYRILGRFWRFDAARLKEVAVIGLPIAGAMLLEIAVFSTAAITTGWLGAVPVAAHAIAIQVASATFMVPMGIGQPRRPRRADDRRGAAGGGGAGGACGGRARGGLHGGLRTDAGAVLGRPRLDLPDAGNPARRRRRRWRRRCWRSPASSSWRTACRRWRRARCAGSRTRRCRWCWPDRLLGARPADGAGAGLHRGARRARHLDRAGDGAVPGGHPDAAGAGSACPRPAG
jgi:MATE family multidrug resistance protein